MKEKTFTFIATFCYLGFSPYAPGTMGTLGAAGVYGLLWALGLFHVAVFCVVLAVFSALTVWLGNWAEGHFKAKDPQVVVIDEVAGFFLTVFLFHPSWAVLGGGVVLFRLFDIVKPFPVHRCEALPGGIGILVDDLVAGMYAFTVLTLISWAAHMCQIRLALAPALWVWGN